MRRLIVGPGSYRIDDKLKQGFEVPGIPGLTLADAWKTEEFPVDNSATADLAHGPFTVAPDKTGTLFRVITFPPKSVMEQVPDGTMAKLGAEAPSGRTDNLMWHRTDTIDYITIVSGSILLITELDRHELAAGDIAVVRGILHAWLNPAEQPCQIACVSIAAKPRP